LMVVMRGLENLESGCSGVGNKKERYRCFQQVLDHPWHIQYT
jgi:hypothetical protein